MLLGPTGLGCGVIRLATAGWSMYTTAMLSNQKVRRFGMTEGISLSLVVLTSTLKTTEQERERQPGYDTAN
jgi:hypothetical protein